MDFINTLAEYNYWFIPVIAIVVIALLGIIIGMVNGWKAALYWTIWHTVLTCGVVLTLHFEWDELLSFIPSSLKNKIEDIVGDFGKATQLFRGLVTLIAIFYVILIVDLILALPFYFIFRRKMKRTMKENKEMGKSNMSSRMFGATLGFISAVPIAATLGGLATTVSNHKGINKLANNFAFVSTFGEVKNVSDDVDGLYALVAAASYAETVAALFSGTSGSSALTPGKISELKKPENQKQIDILLTNDKALDLVNSVIDHNLSNEGIVKKPMTTAEVNDFITQHPDIAGVLDQISPEAITNLKATIKKVLPTGTEDTAIDSFVDFLVEN